MSEVKLIRVEEKDSNTRLDRWFHRYYPALSHGALEKMLRAKNIRVNGARAKADLRLQTGDEIRVPPMPTQEEKKQMPLSQKDADFIKSLILYQDKEMIVLNKPAGLAVQGGTKTTLGLGGLFDVASHFEIEKKKRNFAQTLYKWGWKGTSTYFVLPFLGPSDFRETVGMTVGWFLDPIDYVLPRKDRWRLRIGRYTINGIITIEEATDLLTGIETSSVDPYATLRTMYQQNKQKFLNDGDIEAQSESYNFEFDLDD